MDYENDNSKRFTMSDLTPEQKENFIRKYNSELKSTTGYLESEDVDDFFNFDPTIIKKPSIRARLFHTLYPR